MKIYKILFLFIVTFYLFSCLSDKGNYDYKKYDDLSVSFSPYKYSVTFEESVVITPIVKYRDTKNQNIPEINYEWSIDNVVLSTEKTFTFTAGNKVDEKTLVLTIEDKKSGAKYAGYCILLTESAYKTGFMILHEDESGNSDISMISTYSVSDLINDMGEKYDTLYFKAEYKNIYSLANNGASMGKNAVSITEHSGLNSSDGSLMTEITVITENGNRMEDLNGFSFTKETSIENEFPDGMPDNFKTKKVVHACWDSYLIGADHRMFTRRNALSDAYHTSVYKKDFTYNSDVKYDDIFYSNYYKCEALLALEYDKENKRNFIGIYCALYNGDKYNGGRMTILPSEDNEKLMSEVKDVKGDILFSDYCINPFIELDNTFTGQYFIVKENGTYYLRYYEFEIINSRKNLELLGALKVDLTPFIGGNEVLGMVSCKATSNQNSMSIVYFHDGNKIYAYNFEDKKCSVLFDGKGKKIAGFDTYTLLKYFNNPTSVDPLLAIAYGDGTVEVYEMIRSHLTGIIEKPLFKSKENYGKIKQITYKFGTSSKFFASN